MIIYNNESSLAQNQSFKVFRSVLTNFVNLLPEFRDATVQYNLDSATVSLDEVYFPSMVLCNMNTLRRSFIYTLINDVKLRNMNVTFSELQKIVHLIFIAGEDYELNAREQVMLEGNSRQKGGFILTGVVNLRKTKL